MSVSELENALKQYKPSLPEIFNHRHVEGIEEGDATASVADKDSIARMFPHIFGRKCVVLKEGSQPAESRKQKVGVILSGGQAPGGHNVIAGLYDAIKKDNAGNELYGFLNGPKGLLDNEYIILDDATIDQHRNTGGFDIIGSGRTKIESESQFETVKANALKLGINALVVIGGDDSNTNAALLAEYMLKEKAPVTVVGVPKTIDGDLKNAQIETSFGFDTAAKVYSELIGNIQRDARSAKKYWHFIKLMGRSASHITLECALQTRPNMAILSEEVLAKNVSLDQLVQKICQAIIKRSEKGKNYGVILLPEGLIEFIPELKKLFSELNTLLGENEEHFKSLTHFADQLQYVNHHLSDESSHVFSSLPGDIQAQIIGDRDDHGNVTVSQIDTDKLLIDLCRIELAELKSKGKYHGKFNPLGHFMGYEGRCAAPSFFDANYTYALGATAWYLIKGQFSGYIVSIKNTFQNTTRWIPGGVPITMMMNMEERRGHLKPVIQKTLVDLNGKAFLEFSRQRDQWVEEDAYIYPGPIQYFGPREVVERVTKTLALEQEA